MNEHKVTRELLLKPILTSEDRATLASRLQTHLGDKTITEKTIFTSGSDKTFMKKFFPDEDYKSPPLAKYGHTLMALCCGDVKSVLNDALQVASGALLNKSSKSASVPKKETYVATPDTRQMDKEELRKLIIANPSKGKDLDRMMALLQKHYKLGPVTFENYKAICKRFMKFYYPDT